MRPFIVPLVSRREIAARTVEAVFDMRDTDFSFTPGQYVSIALPQVKEGYTLDRVHDFSIASSPLEPETLSIAFRVSDSIFKRALLALPLGEKVEVEAAKGSFILPEDSAPVALVAGGIGTTPFISMLRCAAAKKKTDRPITLFCFNREESSTAFKQEIEQLVKENSFITAQFFYERITSEMFTSSVGTAHSWYVAGPPGMVAAARTALNAAGVEDAKIHMEEFSGY